MGNINQENKSNRLLAGKRYTHGNLGTSLEAFTSTIDIRQSEVYTQENLIPTSSIPILSVGETSGVLKYWHQHKMHKSNLGNKDVYFFLESEPTSPTTDVVNAQIIQADQVTNFISPKYSIPDLGAASTEDAGANRGYNIVVYASEDDSLTGAEKISSANYQFDYKTGVLQLDTITGVSSTEYIFITAYQYVGETLKESLSVTGAVSASQFSGSGAGLTDIPSTAIDGTLSQWTSSVEGYIYRHGEVRISGSSHEQIVFKDGEITASIISASGDVFGSNIVAVS